MPAIHATVNSAAAAEPSRTSRTEQAYPKLIYFHEVPKSNQFAAWQEPSLFTSEVRAAFRSLR